MKDQDNDITPDYVPIPVAITFNLTWGSGINYAPTPEEIKEARIKESQELEKIGYLQLHEDYHSTRVATQEEVEENPHIFIMEECMPACLELWSKNIYTFMVSDHGNENMCWIEIREGSLSEENRAIYENLSGVNVVKFSYHEGTVNFGVNGVGKKAQLELLELAKQFQMQDVPEKEAYISPEEFLFKYCDCYEEYPNPDYIVVNTMDDLRSPGESEIEFLNKCLAWQMGSYNQEKLKKFAADKITKPISELAEEHGMIFDEGRVYLSPFHYDKHLNFVNFRNSKSTEQKGKGSR